MKITNQIAFFMSCIYTSCIYTSCIFSASTRACERSGSGAVSGVTERGVSAERKFRPLLLRSHALPSTRNKLSRSVFHDICKPTSCLYHLIPPQWEIPLSQSPLGYDIPPLFINPVYAPKSTAPLTKSFIIINSQIKSNQISRYAKAPHQQSSRAQSCMCLFCLIVVFIHYLPAGCMCIQAHMN